MIDRELTEREELVDKGGSGETSYAIAWVK